MAIYDLFSKRQKRLRGEIADVYQYDNLSRQLRVQIIHIVIDMLGQFYELSYGIENCIYIGINDTLCREYGLFSLVQETKESKGAEIATFF